MNIVKRRERLARNKSHNVMSSKTKDFLQKICYKKTASVDMTQYGFISDSKVNPVNLLLKPLRVKLETICGSNRHSSSLKKQNLLKRSEKALARSRMKLPLPSKLKFPKQPPKPIPVVTAESKKNQVRMPMPKRKPIPPNP